jgi:hypothetical protein
MSSPAIAQLKFINQIAIESQGIPGPAGGLHIAGVPRPELAGLKVRITGEAPIYVIDRKGFRRAIPFPLTFINLFQDVAVYQGVLVSEAVAQIAEGPALDDGALLVRGACSEDIYLLDRGKKRLISSPEIMDKYDFNEYSIIAVPQILIDAVPTGEVWD